MFSEGDYRSLGSTGLMVSPIGLGTVKFGRNRSVKYPGDFDLPSDEALARLLGVARDCGINLIDTAPAYGSSETRLGKLLGDSRDAWIICTKVGESFQDGHSQWDFSGAATRHSVERSLRDLRTDRIDIALIHCNDDDESILRQSAAMETLVRLKERGDIRFVGASTKSVAGGIVALDTSDVIMVTYNAMDTSQLPVLTQAAEKQVGVLVKKALESGHATEPADALRFALNHPAVSCAIVGTIDEEHLLENVEAAGG